LLVSLLDAGIAISIALRVPVARRIVRTKRKRGLPLVDLARQRRNIRRSSFFLGDRISHRIWAILHDESKKK